MLPGNTIYLEPCCEAANVDRCELAHAHPSPGMADLGLASPSLSPAAHRRRRRHGSAAVEAAHPRRLPGLPSAHSTSSAKRPAASASDTMARDPKTPWRA